MDGRGREGERAHPHENYIQVFAKSYLFCSARWLCVLSICVFLYHGKVVD